MLYVKTSESAPLALPPKMTISFSFSAIIVADWRGTSTFTGGSKSYQICLSQPRTVAENVSCSIELSYFYPSKPPKTNKFSPRVQAAANVLAIKSSGDV